MTEIPDFSCVSEHSRIVFLAADRDGWLAELALSVLIYCLVDPLLQSMLTGGRGTRNGARLQIVFCASQDGVADHSGRV